MRVLLPRARLLAEMDEPSAQIERDQSMNEDTMNATPSSGNPFEKRAKLTNSATLLFQLLRMFWVTELALLLVVLYGLYAGWSAPKQWSDAIFYAAVAQMFIAGIPLMHTTAETSSAAQVRYIAKGDVTETRYQLARASARKMSFSIRVFIGGLLTILIAAVVTWI